MIVAVSHPTGNANLRAVLRAAVGRDLLHTYWTGLAVPPAFQGILPLGSRLRRECSRRVFDEVPWAKIRMRPQREAVRLLAGRMGLPALSRHEAGWACVDQAYRHLDRSLSQYLTSSRANDPRVVYAYEDGAAETFQVARKRGLRCIYDLPTAYWRTLHGILHEECERRPQWAPSISGLNDSVEKLERKDREIELAHTVVVASRFTRASLISQFGESLDIVLTPYGAPVPQVDRPRERIADEPLRIAYAGRLSQPKGIGYLIEALQRVDVPWRLMLAGGKPEHCPPELDKFLLDPRCRWLGHVPHQTLLEHMTQSHVFVFPSLIEGFGLVLLEAMAAGLPVITTPHTAGPDILTDGCEGYIVPIRDPDAIAERIAEMYSDEDRRLRMAANALSKATASSWLAYEDRIGQLLMRAACC